MTSYLSFLFKVVHVYTSRMGFRSETDPVFLSFKKPYTSLLFEQIGNIPNDSIEIAGLNS